MCYPSLFSAGWDMLYHYTSDLLCVDSCRPLEPVLPRVLTTIATPLRVPAWAMALQAHPDRALVRYILHGLTHGFRVGFNRATVLQSASSNMLSAQLHPEVITKYIQTELSLGRMLGPFPASFSVTGLQINRFEVISKGHQPGKWRLITDLSFPPGQCLTLNFVLCATPQSTGWPTSLSTWEKGPCWPRSISNRPTVFSRSTPTTDHSRQSCGRAKSSWTRSSPLS